MNLQERQQLLLERVMERIDFSGEISDGMVLDLIDDEMAGRTPGVPFQLKRTVSFGSWNRDLCLWKSCMMLSSRSSRTATAW